MLQRRWIAATVVALSSTVAHAAITTSPGWENNPVSAASGASVIGGMDRLPNGNIALFDGTSVIELDPSDGSLVQTLHTPAGTVTGAFVRTDPTGSFVLFGDTTNNEITRIPLDLSPPSIVTNSLAGLFDCAFDASGDAYVSASAVPGTNEVFQVDLSTGASDLILTFSGASAPITFDLDGNLFYGENSTTVPAPADSQTIYRFSAASVATAIGPTNLTVTDGIAFITGQTSPFGLRFDEEGDLLVSDAADGSLEEYDFSGAFKSSFGTESGGGSVRWIAFIGNILTSASSFGRFQPTDGGTLWAISTDDATFNDLNVISPLRATISTTPADPIPVGGFTFDLVGGPPNGLMITFVGFTTISPPTPVFVNMTPFLFDLNPASIALILPPVPLNIAGGLSLPASNPGAGGNIIVIQASLIDADSFPLGNTTAISTTFQ